MFLQPSLLRLKDFDRNFFAPVGKRVEKCNKKKKTWPLQYIQIKKQIIIAKGYQSEYKLGKFAATAILWYFIKKKKIERGTHC